MQIKRPGRTFAAEKQKSVVYVATNTHETQALFNQKAKKHPFTGAKDSRMTLIFCPEKPRALSENGCALQWHTVTSGVARGGGRRPSPHWGLCEKILLGAEFCNNSGLMQA